mmetsp:Transcript_66547/g.215071  ORF Transcript_66547/g.215071 Transcript_66547/m.215071 type:complete len:288 (-) Transcript_66547:168-1031(-)
MHQRQIGRGEAISAARCGRDADRVSAAVLRTSAAATGICGGHRAQTDGWARGDARGAGLQQVGCADGELHVANQWEDPDLRRHIVWVRLDIRELGTFFPHELVRRVDATRPERRVPTRIVDLEGAARLVDRDRHQHRGRRHILRDGHARVQPGLLGRDHRPQGPWEGLGRSSKPGLCVLPRRAMHEDLALEAREILPGAGERPWGRGAGRARGAEFPQGHGDARRISRLRRCASGFKHLRPVHHCRLIHGCSGHQDDQDVFPLVRESLSVGRLRRIFETPRQWPLCC